MCPRPPGQPCGEGFAHQHHGQRLGTCAAAGPHPDPLIQKLHFKRPPVTHPHGQALSVSDGRERHLRLRKGLSGQQSLWPWAQCFQASQCSLQRRCLRSAGFVGVP